MSDTTNNSPAGIDQNDAANDEGNNGSATPQSPDASGTAASGTADEKDSYPIAEPEPADASDVDQADVETSLSDIYSEDKEAQSSKYDI